LTNLLSPLIKPLLLSLLHTFSHLGITSTPKSSGYGYKKILQNQEFLRGGSEAEEILGERAVLSKHRGGAGWLCSRAKFCAWQVI